MQRLEADAPRRRPVWWRAAAAAVSLGLRLGGDAPPKAGEHRRGEPAKDPVLEAMRITSEKMRYAQQEVRAIGSHD